MNGSRDGLSLRPILPGDVARVTELDRRCFSLPWTESNFQYEVEENPNAIALLAETAAGALAGFVVTWLIVDEAHIATLAVDPRLRRHGVASRLLAASLRAAHSRGAVRALLEVRESNLAARALYSRFGFEAVGERKRYYQDNHENAVLMDLEKIDPASLDLLLADAGRALTA